MRVAIVAECFLPSVNGVTNSILRLLEHLRDEGHAALVIAATSDKAPAPASYAGFPVVGLPSVAFPLYDSLRLTTTPKFRLERLLEDFGPDVVHLAAPIHLGHQGILAANWLGVPTVAIYQTDVASYAARYGLPQAENLLWWRLRSIHEMATMTLAPSTYARRQLVSHGIPRVGIWGRGVDSTRFHPAKRHEDFRRLVAPSGQRIIGFVGRLAAEKQVGDLEVLATVAGTSMVIVGDGPQRVELERALPNALFTGQLTGDDLPRVLASCDVFVSPGELETFCQTIQEAMASGVPAIAPAQGGPLDLIDSSRTGWLYRPGDLAAMRGHVRDLVGDDDKRRAFSRTARERVEHRTWPHLCAELLGHYHEAIEAHQVVATKA